MKLLLPKIYISLFYVPGRPVIYNIGTPTENASEFLDHHSQPVMKSQNTYVENTNDFLEKLKKLGKEKIIRMVNIHWENF